MVLYRTIDVDENHVYINDFTTINKEIIAYFKDMPKYERSAHLESMILAGVTAFKTIGITEKIDYIEKSFENFHRCFDDKT